MSSIIASDKSVSTAYKTTVATAIGQFHGGVFPPENKSQSMELPIGELPIPQELVFPLNQHMGAPAEPIVNVGDAVLGGQKIAAAVGPFSAAIHASSSGTVTAIEERILPHPSGMSGPCIVIKTDGQHTHAPLTPCENYEEASAADLLEKIREAGITGLGGAGFPTAVKLKPQSQYAINTLILNGTECEPYITADHSLMLNYAQEVVQGAKLLAFILGNPENILIGVEDNKPDAIKALEAVVTQDSAYENINIVTFPTKYPSGGEKQLIQLLTGKEVPSGEIPASLGIVMQNVGTAVAAFRAVVKGQPLTSRLTTFVGESLETSRNIHILLGTPIDFALDTLGFDASNNEKLIMGGPMMGFALPSASIPVVKSTNCVIAPSKQELPPQPSAQECIRCGMCSEACPASLLPQQLYWYTKAEDYERAQNYNLFDCIECGACSFVCPSNIPLVQYYRAAKGAIKQQEQEKVKSDHARQRFEFRKSRIEKAEQEKIAKREARKLAAAKAKKLQAEKAANPDAKTTNTDIKADPVAAAMARVKEKQNDPVAQKAKLDRMVTSATDRLKKLNDKLAQTDDSEQQDRIAAQVKQAEIRLQDAQKQLDDFAETKSANTSTNAATSDSAKEAPKEKDAASSAIEKAKAKKAEMAQMSPEEKQKKQLESLEQRLTKAQERLKKAEEENSEHLDAFKAGVEKLEQKLAEAKKELTS